MKTKIILIGGVPGTGKTTLAYELALYFGIEHIVNVDMIKTFTRTYKEQFIDDEYIFTTTHEAFKLENLSIIDGFKKHALAINEIILKIIYNMKDKVIIVEGATLNKDFINMIDKDRYEMVYFNLYVDREELVSRYMKRMKIREGKWLDNIDKILTINDYILKDNNNFKNEMKKITLDRIVEYVKTNLCL